MGEIQAQREKMLKVSQQFANNQKEQQLKVEIEDLKSHLLKIEVCLSVDAEQPTHRKTQER